MYVALNDVWWKMIVGRGIGTWVVRGSRSAAGEGVVLGFLESRTC